MATLQIDGIGKVNIDDGFLKLSPEQQAAEVDAIAAQVRGGAPAAAATPAVERPLSEDEASTLAAVMAGQPKPDQLANRGSILPVGTTKEGKPTLALPVFLEGPRQTIMDLIEGRRTADQISGKEMFELGGLFAGAAAGGAAGTGAGVARAAAEREALAARPAPSPMAAPAAGVADDAVRTVAPAADDVALARAAAPEPVPPAPVAAIPEPPPTATTAEFKAAAKSYYKQMEDAGVEIAPQATRKLSDEVAAAAQKANIDPTLHPRGTAALKRVQDAADKPLSFERLDQLRQIVKEAGSSPDGGERRIAGVLTEKLDDFIEKIGGRDITAGDATAAKTAIGKAQELWSKFAKLDTVDDLVERAKISAPNFSGSGLENALRTEFRALAKNKQKMRSFTTGEQKAIKRVAKGTVGSNIARAGGKLAPTGIVSGTLSSGLGATIGTMIGIGPVAGAAVATGGGFTARALATKLTQRHVAQLETIIRNGGESRAASAALARARTTLQSLEALSEDAALPTTSAAADARQRR
jgi:hypothetical protein